MDRDDQMLLEQAALEQAALDETPLDETPLDETPLDETPLEETPLEETGLAESSVDEEMTPTLMGRLGAASRTHRQDAEILRRGESVGRYVVLDGLGAGGMGTVYAAYDPQLDRRIAVKLLRHRPGGSQGRSREQTRLLREAQALAKLNDPHVVSVFDVGTHEGRIFLAMELVPGLDIHRWLAAEERPLEDIVEVFRQAGRGLAAAHAAGLVHRDFKGSNVMVRQDGRALVLDFGLARAHGPLDDTADERWVTLDDLEDPSSGQGMLEQALTMTGSVLGTPAYMSPEQRAGAPADAAADQFSFCVAFYQAVYGEHPFQQGRPTIASEAWQVAAPPADSRVPAYLRRILVRGLHPIPGERYPSMETLLKDLAVNPIQRRRRWGAVSVLATVFAVLLFLVVQQNPPKLCQTADEQFAETWNPRRSGDLEAAFTRTGVGYAMEVLATTRLGFDAYRDDWVAMHTDTCEATHVRGEQSSALLDRRMDCLDQRRQEAAALIDLLTEQPEVTIERAVRAVAGLRPVSLCSDSPALLSTLELPAGELKRQQVEALRLLLAKAGAQLVAGQYEAGRKVAEPLVEEALALGYWPLTAEALRRLGGVQEASGEPQAASQSYERAVQAAGVGGHDRMAAEALVRLVRVASYQQADFERSHFFADLARGLLARLSGSLDLEASLADHEGVLALQEGEPEVALEYHRRALVLLEELRGRDHPDIARSLVRLSNVLVAQGDSVTARAELERALGIALGAMGASHPEVAVVRERLAGVLFDLGIAEPARGHLEEALAVLAESLGDDHPKVASTLLTLGQVDSLEGDYEAATQRFEEAYEIYRKRFGETHPHAAVALSNVGSSLVEQGRLDEAVEALERALEIQFTTYGHDHPWVASIMHNLGDVEGQRGNFNTAADLHQRALDVWRQQGETPLVAVGSCGLGRALLGLGKVDEAVTLLRGAVALATSHDDAGTLAECRFVLARGLEAQGAEDDEAQALGLAAYETFAAAPLRYRRPLSDVSIWLQARGVELTPTIETGN